MKIVLLFFAAVVAVSGVQGIDSKTKISKKVVSSKKNRKTRELPAIDLDFSSIDSTPHRRIERSDESTEMTTIDTIEETTVTDDPSIASSSSSIETSTDPPSTEIMIETTTIDTDAIEKEEPSNVDLTSVVTTDEDDDDDIEEFIDASLTENSGNDGAIDLDSEIPENTEVTEITDEATTTRIDEATSTEAAIVETTTELSTTTPRINNKNYNFLVRDNSDIPCTLASMAVMFKVSYLTQDKKTEVRNINLPTSAIVRGTCGDEKSTLILGWTEESANNEENNVTFEIVKDGSTFYVSNIKATVYLDKENFPNADESIMAGNSTTDLRLFSASVKNGIHVCQSVTEVPCGKIVVLIKDVSLIAYNHREDLSDRNEEYCTTKNVSIAAIIGGTVSIVVTIGIIASYAWYRRRTSTFRSELP